jgi:hypothetical protein
LWKLSLGVSVSALRNFLCWLMVALCPLSLVAKDAAPASAVLRSEGGVWVNGLEVTGSTVVLAGDSVETKASVVANIDTEGSSVLVQSQSIVKFEGAYLTLEHGSVSVGTSTLMSVHVNCLKVEPVSQDRTDYDVTDVSGTVQVAARKKDVNIEHSGALHKAASENKPNNSATVHEGEQASRDESTACGAAPRTAPASNGLNTKWLEIGGGGGVGALVLCILLCHGTSQQNVSPSQP